jgi:hypothetical protein
MNLKKLALILAAVSVAAVTFAGGATAATGKAPVLDREQVGPWYSAPGTTCTRADGGSSLVVGYSLRGFSTLPYSSANFTTNGTARWLWPAATPIWRGWTRRSRSRAASAA